jgi:hypothetical protein
MASAKRFCVYAFCIGSTVCVQGVGGKVFGKDSKDGKDGNSASSNNYSSKVSVAEFQWKEHSKLSWEDFRGPVHAADDESAAATDCGIGFRINTSTNIEKPEILVYNTFYVNKSWVRPDARINSILEHEQGHFDLCEIYTRMLRARMVNFNFNKPNVKGELMHIFAEVNNQYENRQQAYESETIHGTDLAQQKKWQRAISQELISTSTVTAGN